MGDHHPLRTIDDPGVTQALRVIQATFGDNVSIESKAKNLLKFGRNTNVPTTGATLWYTGQDDAHETFVADGVNSIDTISSSDDTDTQLVKVEGHKSVTLHDGTVRKEFVVQTVTLTGQTKALLTTPLNRVTRAFNMGTTDFGGEVYIYEDGTIVSGKPSTTTLIHLTIGENNQSEKASTSLSYQDYWLVTEVHAYVLEKGSAFADISMQTRDQGGVFRSQLDVAATSGGVDYHLTPYFIIAPNQDMRLVATSNGASIDVAGLINGYLAIVIDD